MAFRSSIPSNLSFRFWRDKWYHIQVFGALAFNLSMQITNCFELCHCRPEHLLTQILKTKIYFNVQVYELYTVKKTSGHDHCQQVTMSFSFSINLTYGICKTLQILRPPSHVNDLTINLLWLVYCTVEY